MEQSLSRADQIALNNRRTGVTIFQISWIMVFVCLSLVNFQIRSNFAAWPPVGVVALDRVLPTIATAALLVSGIAARGGRRAVNAGQVTAFLFQWRIALLLGVIFTLIMGFQWLTVDGGGLGAQYGTIFRVMVAYHAVHALIIGWMMWGVQRSAVRGEYDDGNPMRTWLIEACARLWYFVIVAWILFYVVLYIV
ncbi:MAG: cytochrome c oxidase subunit 3 [Chloroflexota bacterium]|nr:cytochrome c oxidase subunit 3 [Chloroflexota bacterium]